MLEATRAATGDHLMACVIGANYDLYRYGYEDLPAYPYKSHASGEDITLKYEQSAAYDYEVDKKSVSVYAKDMEAELATLDATLALKQDSYNILEVVPTDDDDTNTLLARNDGSTVGLLPALGGFGVEIGDLVLCVPTAGSRTYKRRVIDVIGKTIDSRISAGLSTTSAGEVNTAYTTEVTDADVIANANGKVTAKSDGYTGSEDTVYYITVLSVEGNTAKVKVHDSAGIDMSVTKDVTLGESEWTEVGTHEFKFAIGTANNGGVLEVGDMFTFSAKAARESTTEFDKIVLDAAPVNLASWQGSTQPLYKVTIAKEFSGTLDDSTWSFATTQVAGVTVDAEPLAIRLSSQLALSIEGRNEPAKFISDTGNIYVSFRVMVIPGADEDIIAIDEEKDITEHFGVIAVDNDIAYGVYTAFKASGGRTVYAIRTRGISPEAFYAAVKKTETDRRTYTFAPMTDSYACLKEVVDFNDTLSQPDVKMWRRTVCGVSTPDAYEIASYAYQADTAGDSTGTLVPLTGTFVPQIGGEVLLQINEDLVFDANHIAVEGGEMKLRSGDIVRYEAIGADYLVKEVFPGGKDILLQSGPETVVSTPMPISLWKSNSPANVVEYIGNRANSFSNRRVLLTWCDGGLVNESNWIDDEDVTVSVPVDNKYLASYIAGLSSAVLPQQSITHTEVAAIDRAPKMYTNYTQKELDEIASYGVLIVTQDTKDTPCYIRHQLTTDIMNGSLYYEDSCTRNLDNISYAMCDILEPYIGKANVTPAALQAIKVAVVNRLIEFTQDGTDDMIGPSLVSWDNLEVYQDRPTKDRVVIRVNLYLPLPLNNIRLYEMAYAADVNI